MYELLQEAGELAAAKALGELALTTFGALDELELIEVAALRDDDGGIYYMLRWQARSLGLDQADVSMVLLPEHLEGDNREPEWLADQLSALLVERVQQQMQQALEQEDENIVDE